MNYHESSRTRKTGLSTLILNKLMSGGSVGSSVRGAISDRMQASVMGLKEKFDPLNIASKLTGGSRIGPAMLGRMTGRSKEDIDYFANRKRIHRFDNVMNKGEGSGDSRKSIEALENIYSFMVKTRESQIKDNHSTFKFENERQQANQRRHDEVMNVFTEATKRNRQAVGVIARPKPVEKPPEAPPSAPPAPPKPGVSPKPEPAKPAPPSAPAPAPAKPTSKPPEPAKPVEPVTNAKDASDAAKKAKDAKDAADAAKKAKDAADAAKKAKDAADAAKKAKDAKDAADAADAAKKAKDAKDAADAAKKAKDTAKKQEPAPAAQPTATPAPPVAKPPTAQVVPIKQGKRTAEMIGKAGVGLVGGLAVGGLTNAYAQKAILQTSYKESQINSESKESTAAEYLATLNKRGLNYIYQTFPQLKPNSRVSTKEGYKDSGVPESVIREKMQAGNDVWYDYVYGGMMGNDQKGDGWKYRGRGFIAITGKQGYRDLQKTFKEKLNIDVDLVNNPDLLTHPDIASKAALIYYANTLGKGNFDKGLKILNDVKTPDEALKLVIRATAGMGNGTRKGVFDEKEFLAGKTEGGVENKGEGWDAKGSHLYVNYQRALASNKTAEDIMNLSRDNADMKKSLSQGSGAQPIIMNNTTNVSNRETTVMSGSDKGSENPQYKRQ